MKPITSFNGWLIGKITVYLASKQGFITEESCYTATGIKSTVRDAFGYRYEIHVKTLNRIQDYQEDFNELFKNTNSMSFLEKKRN